MEVDEILTKLLSGFKIELMWSLVMAGVIFYALIFFKDFVNNILFYFQFKSNSYVSIGTLVEVNKFVGRIKKIALKYIIVEGERGYYRIPIRKWQDEDWIFLRTQWKNINVKEGQRLGLRKNDDIKVDRKSPEYQKLKESQKTVEHGNEI
jgi:hypothetical protein